MSHCGLWVLLSGQDMIVDNDWDLNFVSGHAVTTLFSWPARGLGYVWTGSSHSGRNFITNWKLNTAHAIDWLSYFRSSTSSLSLALKSPSIYSCQRTVDVHVPPGKKKQLTCFLRSSAEPHVQRRCMRKPLLLWPKREFDWLYLGAEKGSSKPEDIILCFIHLQKSFTPVTRGKFSKPRYKEVGARRGRGQAREMFSV